MRENIGKYRGKQEESGEWIEGSVVLSQSKQAYIVSERECKTCGDEVDCRHEKFPCYKNCIEVIPETVGEYTGLKDKKKDKDLFAGDRVVIGRDVGVLVWDEYELCLALQLDSDDSFQAICRFYSYEEIDAVEYIGNEEKP